MKPKSIFFTKSHEKSTLKLKAVKTGTQKASVGAGAGAGAETFWKSEPELEPKQIVSAPQHWNHSLAHTHTLTHPLPHSLTH